MSTGLRYDQHKMETEHRLYKNKGFIRLKSRRCNAKASTMGPVPYLLFTSIKPMKLIRHPEILARHEGTQECCIKSFWHLYQQTDSVRAALPSFSYLSKWRVLLIWLIVWVCFWKDFTTQTMLKLWKLKLAGAFLVNSNLLECRALWMFMHLDVF